jgi:hypothetical protein
MTATARGFHHLEVGHVVSVALATPRQPRTFSSATGAASGSGRGGVRVRRVWDSGRV